MLYSSSIKPAVAHLSSKSLICGRQHLLPCHRPSTRLSLTPPIAADSAKAQKKEGLDRDPEKEASRRYRRTVFDHKQWAAHRSTNRYFRHMDGAIQSRIVRGLFAPLFYVGCISVVVSVYEELLKNGVLNDLFPAIHWTNITINSGGAFSISTFALSLLLVFRTNSSYDRWVEARKIWGSVTNRARDIARQGILWFPEDAQQERDAFLRMVAAFPVALMCHLREGQDLKTELETRGILTDAELAAVVKSPHAPVFILLALAHACRNADMDPSERVQIDLSVSDLHDALGGTERIFKTPIPLSYTRHTSRFLVLWLTSMPFAVYEQLGWSTTPVATIMAFLLLGIDEIGVSLEEPFSIMALENICEGIQKVVKQTKEEYYDLEQLSSRMKSVAVRQQNGS